MSSPINTESNSDTVSESSESRRRPHPAPTQAPFVPIQRRRSARNLPLVGIPASGPSLAHDAEEEEEEEEKDSLPASFGNEDDPTIREFGNLGEGLLANQDTTLDQQRLLLRRFASRKWLASLVNCPEGAVVEYLRRDGTLMTFRVLSPTEYRSMRLRDGSWTRVNLPIGHKSIFAPYTRSWYREYLAAYGLPPYFMNAAHQAMAKGSGFSEGRRLGFIDSYHSLPPAMLNDETHLVDNEGKPVMSDAQLRSYILTGLPQRHRDRLATLWPALYLATPPSVLVVHEEGDLVLHSTTANADVLTTGRMSTKCLKDVEWYIEHADFLMRAYGCEVVPGLTGPTPKIVTDAAARMPVPDVPQEIDGSAGQMWMECSAACNQPAYIVMDEDERNVREAFRLSVNHEDNALLNPRSEVRGEGTWTWLHDFDARWAAAIGVESPQAMDDLYMAGQLQPNAGPSVLFRSAEHLLNPSRAPAGNCHLVFRTDGDRALAALRLSGQEPWLPAQPTAEHVWSFRQLQRYAGESEEQADGIDIVWVVEEQDSEAAIDSGTRSNLLGHGEETRVEEAQEVDHAAHDFAPVVGSQNTNAEDAREVERAAGDYTPVTNYQKVINLCGSQESSESVIIEGGEGGAEGDEGKAMDES